MAQKMRVREDAPPDHTLNKRRSFREGNSLTDGGSAANEVSAPNRGAASDVLRLQSTIGNQAVQRFLTTRSESSSVRREGEDEETPVLNKAEVVKALSFYRSQPKKYTPEIIGQIQDKIGTPATGTISETDVQAVAKWQQDLNIVEQPSLKADGMAGPRTLPTLFPGGLAAQDQIESYSGEAHEILENWADLGTAEARINKLVELVNKYLSTANVPNCKPNIGDAAGNLGQFDFETWNLDIGKPPFEATDPTPAEKADMADTIYHESRHAEQWYRMAQLRASQGKTAKQIKDEMSIPQEIADKAFGDPLQAGSMDALIAGGWNDSVYGDQAAHRNKVLKELAAADKAVAAAQAAYDKDGTPANLKKLEAAQARAAKAHEAYFDLPEENDANRIGGRVTNAYMANEAVPEAEAP